MILSSARSAATGDVLLILADKQTDWSTSGLAADQIGAAKAAMAQDRDLLLFPGAKKSILLVNSANKTAEPADQEHLRRTGADAAELLNRHKFKGAFAVNLTGNGHTAFAVLEGLVLSNYQFRHYRSNGEGKYTLEALRVPSSTLSAAALQDFSVLAESTIKARDLVNEPLSFLTSVQLAKEFQKMGKEAGFSVSVLNKKKIVELGMGGLLAVNLGSVDPPTFTIMEWKSPKAKNKKPVVLVGKGVVYDTGGLSLKPTAHGMDFMKCDMAGAAAVGGRSLCSGQSQAAHTSDRIGSLY